MGFRYYYGSEADQFNFIKIPKTLIVEDMFSELTVTAKMLYGVLLDRMNLSMKNGWLDEENRVFIHYQISDIMADLKMSKGTAVKYLNELEEFGLIEKKRQGLGRANIIYVKSFLVKNNEKEDFNNTRGDYNSGNVVEENSDNYDKNDSRTSINTQKSKNWTSRSSKNRIQEVQDLEFKKFKNQTSRSSDKRPQVVQELNPNKTKINNNKNNNTKDNNILSNHIPNEYEQYKELIKNNIEYDALISHYPTEKDKIDEIVELMTETVISNNDYILIASNSFNKEVVKSRFLKINFSHISYVLDCMNKNTTKVKNIKKYLLAAIYNAPSTISSYYSSEVNHDFPEYVGT